MAYACFKSDNMSGTILGKDLVSGVVEADEMQNGTIVKIGDYYDDERELRKIAAAGSDDVLFDLGVVAAPEVIKDQDYKDISEFVNKKGDDVRVYRLTPHDEFSVTIEGFAAGKVPSVGDKVGAVDGLLSTEAENVGVCKEIKSDTFRTWYLIEVKAA